MGLEIVIEYLVYLVLPVAAVWITFTALYCLYRGIDRIKRRLGGYGNYRQSRN